MSAETASKALASGEPQRRAKAALAAIEPQRRAHVDGLDDYHQMWVGLLDEDPEAAKVFALRAACPDDSIATTARDARCTRLAVYRALDRLAEAGIVFPTLHDRKPQLAYRRRPRGPTTADQVLVALRVGPGTPKDIATRIAIDAGAAGVALVVLAAEGKARRLSRGVYELVEAPPCSR